MEYKHNENDFMWKRILGCNLVYEVDLYVIYS